MTQSNEYWLHVLSLRPGLDRLFQSFHKDSVQRKIHRAQRENLIYHEGRSETFLNAFYRLLLLTRRRHGIPPQPLEWFQNLAKCLGDTLTVRLASHEGRPIASAITIRHGATMVYKYGASDASFHYAGGMQLVLWEAIQQASQQGCELFDMGRSDLHQVGLATFKDRWRARRSLIRYWQWPSAPPITRRVMTSRIRRVVSYVPDVVWSVAGRTLYKHLG